MIEILPDYSGPIVAASLSGQVSGDEIRDVLAKEVEQRRHEHEKLSLLVHYTPDFRRFTSTAAWDDEIVGLHHLNDFTKVAIITDTAWLRRLAENLSATRPEAVCHFPNGELDKAKDWICAT